MGNKTFQDLHGILLHAQNPIRAKHSLRFFKTGKGEYGEGDKFIGLTTPESQKLVKEFINLPFKEIQKALDGKYHEERLIGLLILVDRYKKGSENDKKTCYNLFINNTRRINNWDLVDVTVDKVIGNYLEDKDKSILFKFAKSTLLWERRIAIMSTFYYIKKRDPKYTLKIAEILLNDKEDLIHKAVGWMLREIGKRCGQETEEEFLKKHYKIMPRTMLRYAIEHFAENKRLKYLHGEI